MKYTVFHFYITSAITGTCKSYFENGEVVKTDFFCTAEIPVELQKKIIAFCEELPIGGRDIFGMKWDGIEVRACRNREALINHMKFLRR